MKNDTRSFEKILNDDELQDVSGGKLKDDWKDILTRIAES